MLVVTHHEVWAVCLQSVTISSITCTKDQLGLAGQLEHLELGQGTNQLKHEENGLHQHLHDFNSSGVPGHDLLIQIQRFSVPSWLPVSWLSGLAHSHGFAMFLV